MPAVTSCTARAVVAPRASADKANKKPAAVPSAKPASLAAASFAAASLAPSAAFAATEAISQTASGVGLAVGGAAAVAGVAGLLVVTYPNRRRESMMSETGGDEAESVRNYFNTVGADRWKRSTARRTR